MKKKNVPTYYLILILLVIFIPLTGIGAYFKFFVEEKINPDKLPFYEGSLYFYDNGNLLGSYKCTTANCTYASSILESSEINYYKDGNLETYPVINNNYVFIKDGDKTSLVDIKTGSKLADYDGIKYYNTINNKEYIILSNNNKYGVLNTNTIKIVIPFEYDYIGLANNLENNILKADKYLVSKNNEYYIIDESNQIISDRYDSLIIDYNDEYVFVKDIGVKIYNYAGVETNIDYTFNDVVKSDNYYGLVTNNMIYIYDNLEEDYLYEYEITSYNDIKLKENNNKLELYLDNVLVKSF